MASDDILSLTPPPADFRLPYGRYPQQFGDLRLPKSEGLHPVVMNIHGGFWRNKYDLAHAGHLCAALTSKGIATWNIEYRRVGDEGGGWPGTFEDVVAGLRFVVQMPTKYKLDAKRIVIMGHSAGGQLALCLAGHEPSARRVISLAGVVDLQRAWELHLSHDAVAEFLGGTPTQVADHYREADPMQLAMKQAEQWVIHGKEDDTVPPDFSSRYAGRKKKQGETVRLVEIPNAGHFELIDPRSAAWQIIQRTVLQLLS